MILDKVTDFTLQSACYIDKPTRVVLTVWQCYIISEIFQICYRFRISVIHEFYQINKNIVNT